MTREEFLRAVENLNVWKRGGRRAPHKPLLLLLALGRTSEGRERLVPYAELETDVRRLLKRFGPPHGMNQPEFPFWHLQSDGLWEVPGGESLPKKEGGRSVPAPALRKLDVRGGLPAEVDRLLRGDRELIEAAVVALLNGHFPDSFHTPIRDAVGLLEPMAMEPSTPYGSAPVRKRDPRFRRAVLTAYERRCAICDFDVRLDDDLLGLDAAHIKWHAAGGPDRVPNGLALCKLHHHALDRGAIGLNPAANLGFTLLVSQELSGTSEDFQRLVDSRGRALRRPQDNSQLPNSAFVAWHRREVFRGEPRPS